MRESRLQPSSSTPNRPRPDDRAIEVERARWEACVDRVLATAPENPRAGLFGPESAMWRIGRELALPIYGMRAVLLQIAHPAVAAAGQQHSQFKEEFIPRMNRTFSSVYAIMFEDRDVALAAARRAHKIHTRIRGVDLRGRPYHANRPDLLFWVLATMIEGAFGAFEKLLRPIPDDLAQAFYGDMMRLGMLFGIPREEMPPDLPAFETYFQNMLDNELIVGPVARDLVDFLYREGWNVGPLDETWASGLFPEPYREAFGLPSGRRWDLAHRALTHQLRLLLRRGPRSFRWVPPYHEGLWRTARSAGRLPPGRSALVHALGRLGVTPTVFRYGLLPAS